MKNSYAQAVVELINLDRPIDLVLQRTRAVMTKHGHQGLYREVLKEVVLTLERQVQANTPIVTVAKLTTANQPAVVKALTLLEVNNNQPRVVVDSTLIGGVVAKQGHRQLDLSYKDALIKLYQAVTV